MIHTSLSRLAFPAMTGLLVATAGQSLPTATPNAFTVVQGNADAVLVSEFALGNGCADVQVDSIARRSPATAATGNSLSTSATVYWTYFEPKLDSASAVLCQNVRRLRRFSSSLSGLIRMPMP